ncbi:MAG: 2OG-Fe(II) oxygenase [Cyclobacteriaceae bacterium]|nr:2OG-Fe(II) oxygenase [Cyclobacteriaceae bacterium]
MNADITVLFNRIADGLADQSFAVIDHFLSAEETSAILGEDEFVNHKLHFRKAGIGKTDKQFIDQVRGDFIQWIDPARATPAERIYLDRVRELLLFLNQALFLSLKDIEIHRTVYPPGTRYQRHLDQFKSDDHRKLSVICYLNTDWTPDQGGQLRLYLDSGTLDILPEGGKLAIFRSDLIEHEVLPATRERYSLTGWATDRPPELHV